MFITNTKFEYYNAVAKVSSIDTHIFYTNVCFEIKKHNLPDHMNLPQFVWEATTATEAQDYFVGDTVGLKLSIFGDGTFMISKVFRVIKGEANG